MQDKLLALWQQIEPRLRPIAFFVFLAMLLAEIFLWYKDASSSGPAEVVQRLVIPESPDPVAQQEIGKIQKIAIEAAKPIEDTQFRTLIVADMFSVRQVLEAIGQEREANALCDTAYSLLQQQKYSEALEACEKALRIRPEHIRARDLKKQIRERLKF